MTDMWRPFEHLELNIFDSTLFSCCSVAFDRSKRNQEIGVRVQVQPAGGAWQFLVEIERPSLDDRSTSEKSFTVAAMVLVQRVSHGLSSHSHVFEPHEAVQHRDESRS